jgi:hypothetical protein
LPEIVLALKIIQDGLGLVIRLSATGASAFYDGLAAKSPSRRRALIPLLSSSQLVDPPLQAQSVGRVRPPSRVYH